MMSDGMTDRRGQGGTVDDGGVKLDHPLIVKLEAEMLKRFRTELLYVKEMEQTTVAAVNDIARRLAHEAYAAMLGAGKL